MATIYKTKAAAKKAKKALEAYPYNKGRLKVVTRYLVVKS